MPPCTHPPIAAQRRSTSRLSIALVSLGMALMSACANTGTSGNAAGTSASGSATTPSGPTPRAVASRDGSFQGEVTGTARPGSRFERLKIGMNMKEVQDTLGRAPDRWHNYETGKRWIPFYFGNDARRMQVLYQGEGCLGFTDGNIWGGAGGDLIRIDHDPSGACYQP